MNILFFLVVAVAFGVEASANPFMQGGAAPANVNAFGLLGTPFMAEILHVQKQVHEGISANIEALKAGASLMPLWGLLLGSFLYGVFHVLAPGHGKIIIAAYFLCKRARWREGVMAAWIMAIGHTITAVLIVGVLYAVLGLTQFGTIETARYVECVGYGLIVLIGIWIFMQKIKGEPTCHTCGHAHEHPDHHHEHDKKGLSLFSVTSLVPCTGSMIILLFTLTHQILWAGIAAVLAIAFGMWITMTLIGLSAIFLRFKIEGQNGALTEARARAVKILGILASLVIIVVGSVLFLATVMSLPA